MASRSARKLTAYENQPGGRITSISAQKKKISRVNISIDGEYAFSVHVDVLLSENLIAGQSLSEDQIQKICSADDYHLARDLALHFVSYRPRSIQEVKRRLQKANYNISTIDRVITRLLELNMLDDESFASEFIGGRIRNKGYGPRRLKQDLRQKGIHESVIDKTLSEAFAELDPEAMALSAGKKIFPRLSKIPDAHTRRKKLSDYLARRGFEFDHMIRAIDALELYVQNLNS